jgi:hypothetical protein
MFRQTECQLLGAQAFIQRTAIGYSTHFDRPVTATKNGITAAAANPEILPLEFLLGDDPFMDR